MLIDREVEVVEVVDVEDALVDRWHSSVDIIVFESKGLHIIVLITVLEFEVEDTIELEVELEVVTFLNILKVLVLDNAEFDR